MDELRDGDPRQIGGYFAAGPSLASVVGVHGPLPVPAVLSLAAGLADALSAAHAASVTHGNLTPVNVLLAPDGPRLTGFGTARPVDRSWRPVDGPPPGLHGFMAPEQANGLVTGPASDMYSLGAVLLYAATGEWMSYFAAHPDRLAPELRPLIERCLAADPARRPTAAELLSEPSVARAAPPWVTVSPPPSPARADHRRQRPRGRVRAMIRRHGYPVAIVTLACAVIAAGVVYIVHPWPYPLLRPSGLAAIGRGMNSITLGWSNPASGPLPDKYVIVSNGAVAATVPGDVNHFADRGLAPATTYDFRVIAYRGTHRSAASPDLHVATETPPLSDAALKSSFAVAEKIEGGGYVLGDSDGTTWHDVWRFKSDCSIGPCTALLTGQIDGVQFTARLRSLGGDQYTGSSQINKAFYCGTDTNNTVDSTLYISISAAVAHTVGLGWQATRLTGGATWTFDGDCGGSLVLNVSG